MRTTNRRWHFLIGLNYRDSRPIYEQIKDNYKRLILSGGIAAGDKLPSVRELASQLAINPNTIQRAYRELESEGFIYTVPGKGSFAGEVKSVDPAEIDRLLSDFDKLVSKLILLGVKGETLCARITDREEKRNDRN
jgi:GntR family transcriptional regulator